MSDEYWDEEDTPYSDNFYFWPDLLHQYFNKLLLGKEIKSAYITWNSEQHRLTTKYEIICSLLPLVKHYFVTMEEDYIQFKITYQLCNGFSTCKGRSG